MVVEIKMGEKKKKKKTLPILIVLPNVDEHKKTETSTF